jgi:hypothetical protein
VSERVLLSANSAMFQLYQSINVMKSTSNKTHKTEKYQINMKNLPTNPILRGRRGSWIYNLQCNQYLSLLM